jgi:hypothetical protein
MNPDGRGQPQSDVERLAETLTRLGEREFTWPVLEIVNDRRPELVIQAAAPRDLKGIGVTKLWLLNAERLDATS